MRRLAGRRDRGFTLVELLVAMILLGIIGTVVMRSFLSSSEALTQSDSRNRSTQQLAVVTNLLTKTLQSAYRLQSTGRVLPKKSVSITAGDPATHRTPTNTGVEATFYADLGGDDGPAVVHWYVDGEQNLVQEILRPDPGSSVPGYRYGVVPTERKILLGGLLMPAVGERPIFTWFSSEDTKMLNSSDPYTALSDGQSRDIAGVELFLSLKSDNKSGTEPQAVNFVGIPAVLVDLANGPAWPKAPTNPAPPPTGSCPSCGGISSPAPTYGATTPPVGVGTGTVGPGPGKGSSTGGGGGGTGEGGSSSGGGLDTGDGGLS